MTMIAKIATIIFTLNSMEFILYGENNSLHLKVFHFIFDIIYLHIL